MNPQVRQPYGVLVVAIGVLIALVMGVGVIAPGVAVAQGERIIYPSQGQSQEQLEKDKYECYSSAKQQSGFDPMVTPKASAPPPQQEAPKGGVVRGALGGAVAGAIIGEIADDDPGKGAAIGATAGGIFGGMRRQQQKRTQAQEQQNWAQQQVAQLEHQRSNYNRAYGACLEGRGYTVK